MKKLTLLIIGLAAMGIAFSSCGNKITGGGKKDITVSVVPHINTVPYGDSVIFYANVFNTSNRVVTWYVNNDSAGNDSLGNLIAVTDTSARYLAPPTFSDVTFDSVVIKAVSIQDSAKSGTAVARIVSPFFVFVDSATGDDQFGIGSIFHPYRTITTGIDSANAGQIVKVGPGTYSEGEAFPLRPKFKTTIRGSGINATRVGVTSDTAAFILAVDTSVVESLAIVGVGNIPTGLQITPSADSTKEIYFRYCSISNCEYGIVVNGKTQPIEIRGNDMADCINGARVTSGQSVQILQNSIRDIDSSGVIADSSASVILTDNFIDNCFQGVVIGPNAFVQFFGDTISNPDSIGVKIELGGLASLGDTTFHGGNVFIDIASGNWAIYNADTLAKGAVGNTWPSPDSATIDTLYIYDDDEDATKGPVRFLPLAR